MVRCPPVSGAISHPAKLTHSGSIVGDPYKGLTDQPATLYKEVGRDPEERFDQIPPTGLLRCCGRMPR
jgi:hypothetical protein